MPIDRLGRSMEQECSQHTVLAIQSDRLLVALKQFHFPHEDSEKSKSILRVPLRTPMPLVEPMRQIDFYYSR